MDGKMLRGSKTSPDGTGALHLVSAYATAAGLVLGRRADLESQRRDASIDAMGTAKEIAGASPTKARTMFALKGNQTSLHEDER